MGGEGSEAHRAALVGDAVGEPLKDAAGPAVQVFIKAMAAVSLVIAPILPHV
jgi:K(+)-stimulated pyrophosphate-energized sodium pump